MRLEMEILRTIHGPSQDIKLTFATRFLGYVKRNTRTRDTMPVLGSVTVLGVQYAWQFLLKGTLQVLDEQIVDRHVSS